MAGITNIYYAVEELSEFSDNTAEYHYVEIKRVVRYLSQYPEKGMFWCRKEPKMTLTVRIIIPKVDMETQRPDEINLCEAVIYIDASHATYLRSRRYVG